eukprot:466013-Pyramimonas_sp.AAC.1
MSGHSSCAGSGAWRPDAQFRSLSDPSFYCSLILDSGGPDVVPSRSPHDKNHRLVRVESARAGCVHHFKPSSVATGRRNTVP